MALAADKFYLPFSSKVGINRGQTKSCKAQRLSQSD